MATVRDILARKGAQVFTIGKHASVLDAALLMNEHRIGSLVALDDGRVIGMFTERDVLQRVVAGQRDPARTLVAEVMTTEVACCTIDTDLAEARGAMKNRRIRHLPVVDGDQKLLGMVSIGDLNAFEASDAEHTIHLLQEYLYGRV
jgi:CBS domain-containing protein